MGRALPLLAVALLSVALAPAGAAPTADPIRLYLPLLSAPEPLPAALPPEQLGTPLPVGSNPPAFFADQIGEPGGKLAIWLPPGREVLRGIFFANGSALKPNPADPVWRNEVAQQRLLAARQLASLWGFAFVAGDVWDLPQPSQHLDAALRHWATATGHPELAHAPLVIDGGSRFGGFCRGEAARHFTGRILACTVIVAGAGKVTDDNRAIPSLVILGEQDRGLETISGSVLPARQAGALIAGAVIWGKGHVCDRCQDLTWPYYDRLIRMRLAHDADPRGGPVPLGELAEGRGYVGSMASWTGPWAYDDAPADPRGLAWLPDRATAMLWRAFALNSPPARITKPTSPYSWSNGFSQEPSSMRASEIFTVEASITAPVTGPLTFYNGERPIGVGTLSADGKRLTLAGVRLEPGMHSLFVMGEAGPVSWPAGLIVLP